MIQGLRLQRVSQKLAALTQRFVHLSSITAEDEVSHGLSMHST